MDAFLESEGEEGVLDTEGDPNTDPFLDSGTDTEADMDPFLDTCLELDTEAADADAPDGTLE